MEHLAERTALATSPVSPCMLELAWATFSTFMGLRKGGQKRRFLVSGPPDSFWSSSGCWSWAGPGGQSGRRAEGTAVGEGGRRLPSWPPSCPGFSLAHELLGGMQKCH